jgi:hypothetical protein
MDTGDIAQASGQAGVKACESPAKTVYRRLASRGMRGMGCENKPSGDFCGRLIRRGESACG